MVHVCKKFNFFSNYLDILAAAVYCVENEFYLDQVRTLYINACEFRSSFHMGILKSIASVHFSGSTKR